MKSKLLIKGFDGYVFGEDGYLYKLPYSNKNRNYGLRKLSPQKPNRYKINGRWLSETQMSSLVYADLNPKTLFDGYKHPFEKH